MRGLEGNFQAQPRVFGHDAVAITADAGNDIANTSERGCCLYIGTGGDIQVIMEGGTSAVTFKNVPDGHFLPILVTRYVGGTVADVLAIF